MLFMLLVLLANITYTCMRGLAIYCFIYDKFESGEFFTVHRRELNIQHIKEIEIVEISPPSNNFASELNLPATFRQVHLRLTDLKLKR